MQKQSFMYIKNHNNKTKNIKNKNYYGKTRNENRRDLKTEI